MSDESSSIKFLCMLIERMNVIEEQNADLLKVCKNSKLQCMKDVCSCMISSIEYFEDGNVKKIYFKTVYTHNKNCTYVS